MNLYDVLIKLILNESKVECELPPIRIKQSWNDSSFDIRSVLGRRHFYDYPFKNVPLSPVFQGTEGAKLDTVQYIVGP